MNKEKLITADEVCCPREVIARTGRGDLKRFILYKHTLNKQMIGYHQYALGIEPSTGKRISLAPNTRVELGRPIV